MPFPLHKAPLGLLDLFRLRTLGQAPNEFGQQVTPVVDVGAFYGADLQVATQGAPTVGALLNLAETVALTPVSTRLRGIAGRLTVGAAPVTAGGWLEVGITRGPANTNVTLFAQSFGVAAAGAQMGVGGQVDLVLAAGWTLYAVAQGTAAGADHSLLCIALIEPYIAT